LYADAQSEGFRALRSDPMLVAQELFWRWIFGLGLLGLLFLAYSRLREAILLSDTATVAIHTRDPVALASAAAAIIATTEPLLVRTLGQIFVEGGLLWTATSALGRGVLTRTLVRRYATDYGAGIVGDAPRWETYAFLKAGRVLMMLILVIGYLSGVLLASVMDASGPNILLSVVILVVSMAVAAILWSYVDWVLSLAPIFVARDGLGALEAVVAAMVFLRRNRSALVVLTLWNATLRGLSATFITLAGLATAAMHARLPFWLLVLLLGLEALLYLVVSDYLLLGRYAAYAAMAVDELGGSAPPAPPVDFPLPPAR
jgi:hypothetical protein